MRDEVLIKCDEISALIQKTFGFKSCVLCYRDVPYTFNVARKSILDLLMADSVEGTLTEVKHDPLSACAND